MKFRVESDEQGKLFSSELFRLKYSFPVWGFRYNNFGEFGLYVNNKNRGISYINSEKEFNEHPAAETTLEQLKEMK